MQSTILVPTDFSDNAAAAAAYAAGMALHYGMGIHFVHAYLPFTTRFGEDQFNLEMRTHAREQAESSMEKLYRDTAAAHPGLAITNEVVEGPFAEVLLNLAGKASHQLLIMGTAGAGGLKDRVLGTNTFQMVHSSPIPMLAVPEDVSGFRLDRAGLLSNFKSSDIPLLSTFISIFGSSVEVTLLHVRETDSPREEAELLAWRDRLAEATGASNLRAKIDTIVNRLDVDENLPECIHNLADEASSDLLLITYNTKSFLKRLLSRSLVRNIAHRLDRPVFFLQDR